MSLFQFTKQPFFNDKNRAFWRLQIAGWGGVMIYRMVLAIANSSSPGILLTIFISTVTGISLSLFLAAGYRKLLVRPNLIAALGAVTALALAASLYAAISAWVFFLQSPSTNTGFGPIFLASFFLDATILAAWSALYFAINFFLQIEVQNDKLRALTVQATQAQLAMLRYQLNPHFLFNTLNSISTLVLMQKSERANAMLSRLSAFLRHTLENEAHARVTLEQEIETLKLYVEIEEMRFEERLRPQFDIDDNVKEALLPSLLLQPLVENAIKYAVSTQEEGADIHIRASKFHNSVHICVEDSGPGTHSLDSLEDIMSTGVGLGNIGERLRQAYGNQHSFTIKSAPEDGFKVNITIPLQTSLTAKSNFPQSILGRTITENPAMTKKSTKTVRLRKAASATTQAVQQSLPLPDRK